jgi:hypothetical protein
MLSFDSILSSGKGRAIEDVFSREQLASKFVVWKKDRKNANTRSEHRVYPSYRDFEDELAISNIEDKIFHEVIIGNQKLKFDIDMSCAKQCSDIFEFNHSNIDCDEIAKHPNGAREISDFMLIINYIIHQIRQEFFFTYEIDLNESNIVICDSSRVGVKYSAHIIIDGYCVENHEQAAEFTRRLLGIIGKQYRAIFDSGVNRSIQNFRVAGCHNGDGRIKTIISAHEFADTLISYTDNCVMLPNIITSIRNDTTAHCEGDVKTAVELASEWTIGHRFRGVRRGVLTYDRTDPTLCEICEEIHHNDNSMMITMAPTNRVIKLFMMCRQSARGEDGKLPSMCIGEFTPVDSGVLKETTGWSSTQIARGISANKDVLCTRVAIDKIAIADKNVYCEPTLRDFELTRTLLVQAAMKMGKTKKLKEYIVKHFAVGAIRRPKIRIVSFRQTFSSNIKEKLPDFTLYSDIQGELTQDRLIIQIESLHRLSIKSGDEVPDLLILDECESIFEQFNAGLIKNGDCFGKFAYLMKNSRHVVCMDALINDRSYNVLGKLRGTDIFYHYNTYKNATEDTYNITHNSMEWNEKIFEALTDGHRIAIPMSSLKKANELERVIRGKFPNLRIKLYSSETRSSEKKVHLGDVNTYWSQYDVLIYTPTISAGVSFEVVGHFAKVFGYFTDKSCPVETCIQMLGRIRDVEHKEYYICLAASGGNYPCEISEIKCAIRESRMLLDDTSSCAVQTEYTKSGDIVIHKTAFFDVWIENVRMINISKNYFILHFIDILRGFGATIVQNGEHEGDVKTRQEIADGRKEAKIFAEQELADRIVKARDITQEEVEEIREIIDAQQNEYDRFRLRQDYDYSGEITPKFAVRYFPLGKRKIYKNIKKIFTVKQDEFGDHSRNHADALALIQKEEFAIHRYYMESGLDQKDLLKQYMYAKHRIAVSLIEACGWDSLCDDSKIDEVAIARNLRKSDIATLADSAVTEFGLHKPKIKIGNMSGSKKIDCIVATTYVKFINRVISMMYDAKIAESKGELGETIFMIRGSSMFKFGFGVNHLPF